MSVLLGSPSLVKKNEDSRSGDSQFGRTNVLERYALWLAIVPYVWLSAYQVTLTCEVLLSHKPKADLRHADITVLMLKIKAQQDSKNPTCTDVRTRMRIQTEWNRKPTCAIWPWKCSVVPEMTKICPPTTVRTKIQHRRKKNEISTLFTSHLTNQSVAIIMIEANQSPISRRRVHGTLGPWEQQNTVQWLNSCIKVRENSSHC